MLAVYHAKITSTKYVYCLKTCILIYIINFTLYLYLSLSNNNKLSLHCCVYTGQGTVGHCLGYIPGLTVRDPANHIPHRQLGTIQTVMHPCTHA